MNWSQNEKDFDRRLKSLDERLYLFWNPNIQRFEVYRWSLIYGGSHHILTIKTETGGFKQPTMEDFGKIKDMDTLAKGITAKDLTKGIDEWNNKKEQRGFETIHEVNKYYSPLIRKHLRN